MKTQTFDATKLKALRDGKHWTLHEMSVEISVYARAHDLDVRAHPDTIDNWEKGTCCPPADMLPVLTALFGRRVQDLYRVE